jgi:hypothetical protein
MVRELKPGEKVIVLLFIHCLPLQAKYAWPYVIESRLNDLIYIVNTPTKRNYHTSVSFYLGFASNCHMLLYAYN